MKTLVAYYSRTGTTAKIAKEISKALKCDIEEIRDTKKRFGFLRWFIAGRDGSTKQTTKIEPIQKNPSDYDLVVIGTPIWVNATPAIRTYVIKCAGKFKKVAFFCTMGGTSGKKVFDELSQITNKTPIATLAIPQGDVISGSYTATLQQFISEIS